jgi:hypothetical protein
MDKKEVQQQEYQENGINKRAHGLPFGMLAAHASHKVAFQGRCLFFFRGSYYFIYTFQLGCAITTTDVDIKVKLDLRGTPAAQKELKDWRRTIACMPFVYQSMLPFVCQPVLTHRVSVSSCERVCVVVAIRVAGMAQGHVWPPHEVQKKIAACGGI